MAKNYFLNLLKKILYNFGIYEYIKYSFIFGIYESLYKPNVKKDFIKEKKFYSSFLSEGDLFFDIGGYDGHKTEVFLCISKKVVCCEPDTKNFKTLQIRFRNKKNVFCENIALAANAGNKEMFIHHRGSAFNTLNEKFSKVTTSDNLTKWSEKISYSDKKIVQTTTLNDLIAKYGKPDFIKIDVEGYELEVLKGLSHKVPSISIECLFPEFKFELLESLEHVYRLDINAVFNIAINEELQFSDFKNKDFLINYLEKLAINHFELIIKMTN